MLNKLYIVVISLLLITAGCRKQDVTTTTPPTVIESNLPAVTKLNESYGTDPLQKMDIYLPAKRTETNTKVLVFIHGGAWSGGDKSDEEHKIFIDTVKKRLPDWAIVNLNYRLAAFGANYFPTQENDVNAAILQVYNKRKEYAISDKWVLSGASAGGHLAMLQAFKNNTVIKPKAVVNYFGPSDVQALANDPILDAGTRLLLTMLINNTGQASSPINFINAQTPPTITFQGTNDTTVPPSQQTELHKKLKAAGVAEKLELYTGEGHGFAAATYTKSFDAVIGFLNTYVK